MICLSSAGHLARFQVGKVIRSYLPVVFEDDVCLRAVRIDTYRVQSGEPENPSTAALRNDTIPSRGSNVCRARAVYQESFDGLLPGSRFKDHSRNSPGLAKSDSRISTWRRSSDSRTKQVRTLVSRTGWYPTLERTSPREVSPRAPCAFDLLTIGSSCDSRSFSRFASVFLGWQAK